MNIQALLVVLVLGGGMIASGVFLVKGQIAARLQAELVAQAEELRADLAERQIERLEAGLEDENERQEALQKELQTARDTEATTSEVLEDRDRFDRLTQAKPGLLERQARTATTKVWRDIEDVSRD